MEVLIDMSLSTKLVTLRKQKGLTQTDKGSKGKILLFSIALLFIAGVLIGTLLVKKRGNEDESVLPMENMTVEKSEYDETVIIPME